MFANDEAISSYRSALAVVGPGRPPDELMAKAAVQLRAKLANVLYWRSGRHVEARELLHEAIGLVDEHDSFLAARLQNLLGRTEIENHDYAAALAAFDAAEAHLGDRPGDQDQAVVALWLEIQLEGRALLYYFNNEPAKLAAVLDEVGPVVQARGGPSEKQYFLTALHRCQLVQRRHRVDEEIIATARAALAAAEKGAVEPLLVRLPEPQRGYHEVGWKQYNLGRCLVLHGDLDEAEETLNAALATANRIGEEVLRAAVLEPPGPDCASAPRRRGGGGPGGPGFRSRERRPSGLSTWRWPRPASLGWLGVRAAPRMWSHGPKRH